MFLRVFFSFSMIFLRAIFASILYPLNLLRLYPWLSKLSIINQRDFLLLLLKIITIHKTTISLLQKEKTVADS